MIYGFLGNKILITTEWHLLLEWHVGLELGIPLCLFYTAIMGGLNQFGTTGIVMPAEASSDCLF